MASKETEHNRIEREMKAKEKNKIETKRRLIEKKGSSSSDIIRPVRKNKENDNSSDDFNVIENLNANKANIGNIKQEQSNYKDPNTEITTVDYIILIILTILGFYSRFYTIEHPPEVAFDEQHFGKFTNWYIKGEYYLDIHPPLGKLLFTALSYFIGYDGNIDFDDTVSQYPDPAYIALRSLPAFFGALFVPLTFLTLRTMRLSTGPSALGAWMVLCENIILTETKHILCDGFLFFFDLLCVFCTFTANNKKPLSPSWFFWMIATGVAMGLAVSVKLTAMGVIAAVGAHQIFMLFKLHKRDYPTILADFFFRGCLLLIPLFLVFIVNFVIHLIILPYTGDGDGFMSAEFRARLVHPDGSPQEEYAYFEPLGMFASIKELIRIMHEVNIALKATHPFQSWWNEWPLIQCKALLFWQRIRDGYGMWMYCVGNPFNWLSSAILGVFTFFLLILFGCYSIVSIAVSDSIYKWRSTSNRFTVCLFAALSKNWWAGLTIFIGYLTNFLPFSLIPRATWNYHYIPALIFAILLVCVVVEIIFDAAKRYHRVSFGMVKFLAVFLFAGSTFAFLYMAPWTYSLPMTNEQHEDRFLFHSWRA